MSTPIETNTEELNEILQTVYNLPNRSSADSEGYDLLFRFETPEGASIWEMMDNEMDLNSLSIASGNLEDVMNKLKANIPVKCGVIIEVYYWDELFHAFANLDYISFWPNSNYITAGFYAWDYRFYFEIENGEFVAFWPQW